MASISAVHSRLNALTSHVGVEGIDPVNPRPGLAPRLVERGCLRAAIASSGFEARSAVVAAAPDVPTEALTAAVRRGCNAFVHRRRPDPSRERDPPSSAADWPARRLEERDEVGAEKGDGRGGRERRSGKERRGRQAEQGGDGNTTADRRRKDGRQEPE